MKVIQSIFFLALVLVCFLSYGQNNMEDLVYLKNGSIFRGIIVEQVPNKSIKIQTRDSNIFVFKFDEIEKITKEILSTVNLNNTSKSISIKKKGFINITEINYCNGIDNVIFSRYNIKNNDFSFGVKTINGLQINDHISLGIGIGIDKYKNSTLLPITLDAGITILKGKFSPIFTASVGYAKNIGYATFLNEFSSRFFIKGGPFINPQIGIKTYISKNVAYLFNFGYKMQRQGVRVAFRNFQDNEYYIDGDYNVNFSYFTVSTGFAF